MKYQLLARIKTCLTEVSTANVGLAKRKKLWGCFLMLFATAGFAGEPNSISQQLCDQDLFCYEVMKDIDTDIDSDTETTLTNSIKYRSPISQVMGIRPEREVVSDNGSYIENAIQGSGDGLSDIENDIFMLSSTDTNSDNDFATFSSGDSGFASFHNSINSSENSVESSIGIRGESSTDSSWENSNENRYSLCTSCFVSNVLERVPLGDIQVGLQVYRQGAESRNPEALFKLGFMYHFGIGVPQDLQQAFNLYWQAATLNNATAQSLLGAMYYYGEGTPKNFILALELLEKAVQQGEPFAQYHLACLYENGDGHSLPCDNEKAIELYHLASEQGLGKAQLKLGLLYGFCNNYTNYIMSFVWFGRAEANGERDGKTYKNLIRQKMSLTEHVAAVAKLKDYIM